MLLDLYELSIFVHERLVRVAPVWYIRRPVSLLLDCEDLASSPLSRHRYHVEFGEWEDTLLRQLLTLPLWNPVSKSTLASFKVRINVDIFTSDF